PMQSMEIELSSYNISEKMENLYEKAKKLADREGFLTFSALLMDKTPREKIETLLPVLHLVQDSKLTLSQEKMFGEIFIHV
ncbi:MAG: hypothetical protein ABIH99_03820, partial [Candidatus Micrarchaeota archaeon]